MVGGFEGVEAQQDVGVLTKGEAEVAPFERDVAEPHERAPGPFLLLQPRVVGGDPRQRHAPLQTALDVEKRDLQIHGRGEIGLSAFQLFEP